MLLVEFRIQVYARQNVDMSDEECDDILDELTNVDFTEELRLRLSSSTECNDRHRGDSIMFGKLTIGSSWNVPGCAWAAMSRAYGPCLNAWNVARTLADAAFKVTIARFGNV